MPRPRTAVVNSPTMSRSVLAVGWQRGIRCGTGPQREAVVVFGSKHDILRACIAKELRPSLRIPLLDFLVEDRSKIVVVIVRTVVLAMIGLGGRAFYSH